MNRFLKNQWKKVIAVAMLGVMLCGNAMVPVHAAMPEDHKCAYSIVDTSVTGSTANGTHQYVKSSTVKPNGTVEIEYGTCQLVKVNYLDTYKCACGNIKYEHRSRVFHGGCGKGWE